MRQKTQAKSAADGLVVIWIDWYAYHLARFRALAGHRQLQGRVYGIELVGGAGVHKGLVFREAAPTDLPVLTLAPGVSWTEAGQRRLAALVWHKLEELSPAAVLIPGYYTLPALAAAAWCRLRGRRSILMTESTAADHRRHGWKETLKSHALRALFDWAVAGGEPHVRYLQDLRFPSTRIGRYYDVVDNGFFASQASSLRREGTRQQWKLPGNYFLYVGRLAPEKNVAGLLEEFAAYRLAGGSWSLVIAGDGAERAALETRAAGLPVHFTGHRSARELAPYYAFASCFVLPSQREPWGLVVNEAMAAGLPVIASTRCGCAEDLVRPGENGWRFDPGCPGDLAAALERVSAATAGERARLGVRSAELIAAYSPENWAEEVARIVAA